MWHHCWSCCPGEEPQHAKTELEWKTNKNCSSLYWIQNNYMANPLASDTSLKGSWCLSWSPRCFPGTWLVSENEILQNFLLPFIVKNQRWLQGMGFQKALTVSSTAVSTKTHNVQITWASVESIYHSWLFCFPSASTLHNELLRFPWWFAFWLSISSEVKSFS